MLKQNESNKVIMSLSLCPALILTGLVFSSSAFATDPSSSATATVHVSEACSLTSTVITPHTDNMSNGTHTDSLGSTKFTVKCNDASGFALYAIGYSGDEYGATSMLGDNELSIPTGTDASAGNTTSHWSMKISKDTTSYLPNSLTIENSFGSQHIIPSTYTKIASFPSSTDGINGTGTSILATYGVRISGTQAAGTYIGKVKYTLVHPNMVDDSNKPVYPLTENDCPAGYVCYAPNTSDIEGSMASISNETIAASDKAGRIGVSTWATTINLIAPNYKREGYGFAGWSTDFVATSSSTIYGPNETISTNPTNGGLDVSSGAILYPVWVASSGTLQGWMGCSSLTPATYDSTTGKVSATLSSITALTDARDGNTYAVAKLADGQCWMIENLRLNSEHTTSSEDIALAEGYGNATISINAGGNNLGKFVGLAGSEDANFANNTTANSLYSIDGTNGTINIKSNSSYDPGYRLPRYNKNNTNMASNATNSDGTTSLVTSYNANDNHSRWYGYGNYYNWPAAMANTEYYTTYSGNNGSDAAGTSICPSNWHLPLGYKSTGELDNQEASSTWRVGGFSYLDRVMGGTGQDQSSTAGSTQSVKWRSFPNNFVYSGYWDGAQAYNRSIRGIYWSSSAQGFGTAYRLYLFSSIVSPGTNSLSKYSGYTVRCVSQ